MRSPVASLAFLLANALTLTQALPSADLSPRAHCTNTTHLEPPTAFWQIFQEPSRQSETYQLGPKCAQGPPYCAEFHSDFHLSQDANAANQHDLVASYVNQNDPADPRCDYSAIKGPYTLEFEFDPQDAFSASGSNKRIDVFNIDGDIPKRFDGHREYYDIPNWNNIGPLTGALVGSFEVPKAGEKGKVSAVVHGVQPVCKVQYNFRLSFSDGNKGAGSVDYAQVNTTGLRMRFGC